MEKRILHGSWKKSNGPVAMTLSGVRQRSDWIGIFASGLCLLHCVATPFLFVAHAAMGPHGSSHPVWWGLLDILFLILSFLAVYWSARTTSRQWIAYGFWIFWGVLALIVLNEKLGVAHLPEAMIYLPALGLVVLHAYNRLYCQCKGDHCCADR